MSDVWKPVSYTIRKGRAEGFKFTIEIDGKTELVKFNNNLYECPTAEHEAAIEALMYKPQFTQNIQKVDLAAGEAIVRAHIASQANSAAKGGMTSEIAKGLENQVAAADLGAVTDALAGENLIVTENVPPANPAVPVDNSVGVSLKLGGN